MADSSLHKRLDDLRGDMNARFADVHKRLDDLRQEMSARFEDMSARFGNTNARFGDTNRRVDDFRSEMHARFDDLRSETRQRFTMLTWMMSVWFSILTLLMVLFKFFV